jgi:isoleucyl-tRNA synthetase
MESIGSIEELKKLSPDCPDDIELHRPYIDEVTVRCPKCGKTMHRVPEVIDCWFDSGSMPFAQHHYPFENEEFSKSSSRLSLFPRRSIRREAGSTR